MCVSCCPLGVFGVPLLGEVIAVSQVVQVAVNLDVLADNQVFRLDHLSAIGPVRASLQKLAIPEA